MNNSWIFFSDWIPEKIGQTWFGFIRMPSFLNLKFIYNLFIMNMLILEIKYESKQNYIENIIKKTN